MNIGPYALIGELGRGGMGVVLKATDSRDGRTVAIKLIDREGYQDERARMALVREAGATASLRHPNVVSVYDVNQFKGNLYIVMEYLEGASLERLIRRSWPLSSRGCKSSFSFVKLWPMRTNKALCTETSSPLTFLCCETERSKSLTLDLLRGLRFPGQRI